MINAVIFNTDPQNQDLMAQTLTNSGDKAVDMVSDAKNTAVNLFNGGSITGGSGDEGKVVGPGNETHLDLPPPAPD